jgi:hypothetical protein
MLFVVLIPAWAWIGLIVAAWSSLAYQALSRINFRHFAVKGLLVALALQSMGASFTAIFTSQDPISKYACLMGIFGMWLTPVIILVEAVVLVYLYRIWPLGSRGKNRRFGMWITIWLLLSLTLLLAHTRSALLCTV